MFDYETISTALKDEMDTTEYIDVGHGPAKNDLRPILDSWFDDAEKYLKSLGEGQKTASTKELRILTDLIDKNKMDMIGLYNRRLGKIVAITLCNSDGGQFETNNMTMDEKELYDAILKLLLEHRKKFEERFFKSV